MSKSQGRPGDEGDLEGAGSALDPELEQLAKRMMGAKDERARVLAPLSAGEREAMAERMLGSGGRGLVQKRREIWSWAALLAAVLGALVVVGVAWWGNGSIEKEDERVAYSLTIQGEAFERSVNNASPSSEPIQLRPSTALRLAIVPNRELREPPPLMFVIRQSRAQKLKTTFQDDGGGAWSLNKQALEALGEQENGEAELVLVLGLKLPPEKELEKLVLKSDKELPRGISILRKKVLFKDWGRTKLDMLRDIELFGCAAYTKDASGANICELGAERDMVLWARLSIGDASLQIDGEDVPAKPETVQQGTRWAWKQEKDGGELVLRLPREETHYKVKLGASIRVPALEKADKHKAKNQLDEAERALEQIGDSSPLVQAMAKRIKARIERRRGDNERASVLLKETKTQLDALGRISEAVEDRQVLIHMAIRGRRWEEAEEQLREMREQESKWPGYRSDEDYYRAVLMQERGQYLSALALFSKVKERADRLKMDFLRGMVLQLMAELKSVMGHDAKGIEWLQEAQTLMEKEGPCERAQAKINLSWAHYRRDPSSIEAQKEAKEALTLLGTMPCASAGETARLNLLFALIGGKQLAEAKEALEDLRKMGVDERNRAWLAMAELELTLEDRPKDALDLADKLETSLQQRPHDELKFAALFARARAWERLKDRSAAAKAYEDVLTSLDQWARSLPTGVDRVSFYQHHRQAFQSYLDFVLGSSAEPDISMAQEASRLIRLSAGGFLSGLLSIRAEQPKKTQMVPLPGEIELYYHPLPHGWLGIAFDGQGAYQIKRFEQRPTGAELIAPFAAMVHRAKQIRVYADRGLSDISFEELPWQGSLLGDHAGIAYGAFGALSKPLEKENACGTEPKVLIVSDPRGDLGHALAFGKELSVQLTALGKAYVWLSGDKASKKNILEALSDPCVNMFQYDGHASFGDKDMYTSGLKLADGDLLVGEILDPSIVVRVPEVVVLSACDSGREEGLGVARAFLERGVGSVLAAATVVEDRTADRVMRALYGEFGETKGASWEIGAAVLGIWRKRGGMGLKPEELGRFRLYSR